MNREFEQEQPSPDFELEPPFFAYAEFEDGTIYALVNPLFGVDFQQELLLPVGVKHAGSQSFPATTPEKIHPDAMLQDGRTIYRVSFWNKVDEKMWKEPFKINGILFRMTTADDLNGYAEAEGQPGDFPEKVYEVQCKECPRVFKHYSRHIIPPERIAEGGICSQCEEDFK